MTLRHREMILAQAGFKPASPGLTVQHSTNSASWLLVIFFQLKKENIFPDLFNHSYTKKLTKTGLVRSPLILYKLIAYTNVKVFD